MQVKGSTTRRPFGVLSSAFSNVRREEIIVLGKIPEDKHVHFTPKEKETMHGFCAYTVEALVRLKESDELALHYGAFPEENARFVRHSIMEAIRPYLKCRYDEGSDLIMVTLPKPLAR